MPHRTVSKGTDASDLHQLQRSELAVSVSDGRRGQTFCGGCNAEVEVVEQDGRWVTIEAHTQRPHRCPKPRRRWRKR